MQFTDSVPHLNIEVLNNGNIRLENESMGENYAVDIHPIQLRHIAEKMGLVESSDRIVVGATGLYEARCRRCFEPGAPKQEYFEFALARRNAESQ